MRIRLARTRLRNRPDGLEGEFLELVVEDNGSGMTPDVAARAFDPFFTTKDVGKGTGLGLPSVYGFAQQSGGTAELSSAPGQGTEIRIILPVSDRPATGRRETVGATPPAAPEPAAPPVPPAAHADAAPLPVLVIEDDAMVRSATEELLKFAGHTVETAADGREALALLEGGRRYAMMVSDVRMPGGISGIDLARRVRDMGLDFPVLLVSGYSREDLHDLDGRVELMTKPFDPVAFTNRVGALLSARGSAA